MLALTNQLFETFRVTLNIVITSVSEAWLIIIIIIWLCLTRTGNYKIHEFDWPKSILTAV